MNPDRRYLMRVMKMLGCAVALTALLAPGARADEYNKMTLFTFSGPVMLPGLTLPAGTYMFKLPDTQMNRRGLVQVFNQKGTKLLRTLMVVPNQMMDIPSDPIVRFSERPAGAPQAVKTWFY